MNFLEALVKTKSNLNSVARPEDDNRLREKMGYVIRSGKIFIFDKTAVGGFIFASFPSEETLFGEWKIVAFDQL